MKDPLGNVSRICYNAFNLPVSTTDANGIVTKYAYNDAGLVTRMERLDGSETLTSLDIAYDGAGRPVSYTDQDGLAKSFERDAFGKVLKEKFPDGSECAYSYDALGRRTSVIDENGHAIRFGWGRFGLTSRTTAAGQLTDYVRDDLGLVKEVVSKWNGSEDRRIESAYDDFGRLVTVDYGSGETERFAYDAWNRLAQHTRGNVSESYKYDHFGRLVEKRENGLTTTFTYDAWGNRLSRVTKNRAGAVVSKETRTYDRLGRLASTTAGFGSTVTYAYDSKGRLARQTIDGAPIEYEYTKYGQLAGKYLGGKANPDASVTYEYSKSGQIVARSANGVRQTYAYDKKGQLLAVKDSDGHAVESYTYDKAGNMLKKTVGGKTTTFTFDSANQLVSSTTDGVTTHYAYDAAGRLVREGSKTYRYGYLDKVLSVTDGDTTRTYTYHADGQLASATVGGGHRTPRTAPQSETFLWDGLALIQRADEQFMNEPHVGGGNPVASSTGTSYFNDALGTTVGSKQGGKYSAAALTAFGESFEDIGDEATSNFKHQTSNSATFFTGKPYVEGLGHAFWMRNYRAGLAKWQTADPMGYPDGWNALAYCGNGVTDAVDLWGCATKVVDITWNDHWAWQRHLVPGSTLSHQMWRRTYDHLWDSLKVTIDYDIVVDNWNLVNIVVKSISSEYTGNASIVGSATIPIPYGGGSSLTLSRNYAIGWDAPTIIRNSGVDNLRRAWNDETMILHLKVYEVSAFTVTPSILDNFSKQLEFEGEVKATKDVRLYGKAVE